MFIVEEDLVSSKIICEFEIDESKGEVIYVNVYVKCFNCIL